MIVFAADKADDYFKDLHTLLEVQTLYGVVPLMLNHTHLSCDKVTVARGGL